MRGKDCFFLAISESSVHYFDRYLSLLHVLFYICANQNIKSHYHKTEKSLIWYTPKYFHFYCHFFKTLMNGAFSTVTHKQNNKSRCFQSPNLDPHLFPPYSSFVSISNMFYSIFKVIRIGTPIFQWQLKTHSNKNCGFGGGFLTCSSAIFLKVGG